MLLQNPNSQALDLADMAGVEQLAGLVARLEAVAVKLESSGGAGGAGGDAGASVQVQKQDRALVALAHSCAIFLFYVGGDFI